MGIGSPGAAARAGPERRRHAAAPHTAASLAGLAGAVAGAGGAGRPGRSGAGSAAVGVVAHLVVCRTESAPAAAGLETGAGAVVRHPDHAGPGHPAPPVAAVPGSPGRRAASRLAPPGPADRRCESRLAVARFLAGRRASSTGDSRPGRGSAARDRASGAARARHGSRWDAGTASLDPGAAGSGVFQASV